MTKSIRAGSWPVMALLLTSLILLSACAGEGSSAPASTPSANAVASPGQAAGQTPQRAPAAPAEEATAAATLTAVPAATEAGSAALQPTGAAPAQAPTPTAGSPVRPDATQPPPAAEHAPELSALKLALEPVVEGLANPLDVVNAGDGSNRLFVVEKPGTVRIVAGGQLREKPFLDITDRVGSSGSEQGLLGLAFPPDFATRKYFFVDYTNKNGDTVIARYNVTGDANVADPGSEAIVLTYDQPAPNHNGGDLVFGPDGYLWIGTGDGGGAGDQFGNGQNPQTLLGKMLRIDVTSDPSKPYTIPPDNPSLAQGWQVRPEIWAIGLRNPWRYSFDLANRDLWIADVGQNRIEEVDVVRAGSKGGLNFGWPIMEGPSCFQQDNCDTAGLVMPVASYEHGQDGCSITGGFVYRGKQYPALAGVYLYGDYCSGRIWGIDAARPGQPELLFEAGPGLSSFGEDEAGELYVTDLSKGTIRRIGLQ